MGSTHRASAPVAAETVQLAALALTPKEAETAGSSACVE